MAVIAFLFELYFAAMLGVSGLAKTEHPEQFARTLTRHRILPRWTIRTIGRVFPTLEVVIAALLVAGLARVPVAAFVVLLFVTFGAVETILVVTKRATDCGCYGLAYSQKVDWASVAVSSLLTLLAALHLWIVTDTPSVPSVWRLAVLVVFATSAGWLGWRIRERRSRWRPIATVRLVRAQGGASQ